MDVLVLAGGYSAERDVSLASGSKIVAALRRRGHRAMLLDPYKSIDAMPSFQALYDAYAREDYSHAIPAQEPDLAQLKEQFGNGEDLLGRHVLGACKLADVVFLGLHGACGENGQLQAAFDLFDIRYTGSGYAGCMLSMDKTIAKAIMELHGVRTPRGKETPIGAASLDGIELPAVIKPCSGGSSIGVTIVKENNEFDRALAYAQIYESKILIEEYIAGREFTVAILEGRALPVLEIRPKQGFFDYANKYQAGLTEDLCPAPIPEELAQKLQDAALKAHRALRLGDYSRVDFIADESGEIYCLEANSLPGMTPMSLVPQEAWAAGISYEDLCEKIVQLALARGRQP